MKIPTTIYSEILLEHRNLLQELNRKSAFLSLARLLSIIVAILLIWGFFKTNHYSFIIASALFLIAFFLLIKVHGNLFWKRKLTKSTIEINEEEIAYLNERKLPFKNGKEFINIKHFFTYDLDIFGEDSLYQHLNRTATYIGENSLAKRLSDLLPDEKIIPNQKAVEELKHKTEWRQKIYAIGRNIQDNAGRFQNILSWSKRKDKSVSKLALALSFIMPSLLWFSIIAQFFILPNILYTLSITLFFANLFFISSYIKRIKAIFIESESISKTLERYALIIKEIENEPFESEKLKNLQAKLKGSKSAHAEIHRLSRLFGQLENFLNLLGSIISNGLFLYHVRVLYKIAQWKKENSDKIENWMEIMGEFEALNSLSNFAFNNPQYCFPDINKEQKIEFTEVGHPLIRSEVRISNDISFHEHPFVILTGSNMSGKSTFLRTLGINMLLTRAGSVICAKEASVHPLTLLVSMRVEDSLSDNESYFFAEVNRLHRISQEVKKQKCFVLLDEILRGTNSDDKRKGTKEFIKTLMATDITGLIATHDLDICSLQKDYPQKLINKYFEVDIIDDELAFDYKIRNGICQNQSATFLMKKMGII